MTGYRKVSAHTIARRTLYRRRRPPPSLSRPFRASTYRRRRSLFAEAIEPPVNVFSDWSRPRALCMVEKGAPPAQRVASSSQSRRRQQVDQGGHPSQRIAPPRAGRQDRRIPSTTSRLLTRAPPACSEPRGRCGSIVPHCASVTGMLGLGTSTSAQCGTAALENVHGLTTSSTRLEATSVIAVEAMSSVTDRPRTLTMLRRRLEKPLSPR